MWRRNMVCSGVLNKTPTIRHKLAFDNNGRCLESGLEFNTRLPIADVSKELAPWCIVLLPRQWCSVVHAMFNQVYINCIWMNGCCWTQIVASYVYTQVARGTYNSEANPGGGRFGSYGCPQRLWGNVLVSFISLTFSPKSDLKLQGFIFKKSSPIKFLDAPLIYFST